MREIKFRAYNKLTKAIGSALPLNVLTADIADRPGAYYADWNNLELMQYTGLRDKNGKEIYEGDVVVFTNSRDKITFTVEYVNIFCGYFPMCNYSHELEYEIIGNIYENPELLTNN